MSHSNLTRWIEDAEARQFVTIATTESRSIFTERQYLHFGKSIAAVPLWLRHSVSSESLASIGCHALAFVRAARKLP